MGILGLYLLAILPMIVSLGLWFYSKKIVWWEALVGCVSGFIIALACQYMAVAGMYDDVQTLSGQVIQANHYARWQEGYDKEIYRTEYYTVTVTRTRTVGTGKNTRSETYTATERRSREVFDHLEYRTRWHDDHYDSNDTLVGSYTIDAARYKDIAKKFGQILSHPGNRSNWGFRERNNHMIGGDSNDYYTNNINNYVYPVTTTKHWENHVKACPSVFSFVEVPEGTPVNEYPNNSDHFISDRLFGTANAIPIEKWDQLNARIGPKKKVNLIAVGFMDKDSSFSQLQKAKWIGGKKNDIVICFGGQAKKPTWVQVWGWSESELAKRNLESLILETGFTVEAIPYIEKEIMNNYEIRDWHKFDYLTVDIPTRWYWYELIIMTVVTTCWLLFAYYNDMDRNEGIFSMQTWQDKFKQTYRNYKW